MRLALLPVLVLAGCTRAEENCIDNLRQIAGAKRSWMLERNKATNDVVAWDDIRPYFKEVPPTCPSGGTYTVGRVGELPACSIPAHNAYWKAHYP
jgi:hypothetical protein